MISCSLNAMKNAIFNPLIKSRGENDREYLTDFSVNASQSEIHQSSDDDTNCGPPP